MGEQVSERESLAEALHPATCSMPGVCTLPFGNQDLHAADAALAWFTERVEALIDRYDDPGYGMQEDEWRFVRDLRALYATPTAESEDR